ncbi:lipid III flippase WzxE [Otariodibacter sp.]|uniref:lipid III flippase WzxE n=1 Tax=Otariodibacter sp. TaxID=3030919 RepID=UPI0026073065|nr:lipid III flippase WzxE [Otariodibacter sp.]
MSKLATTTLWTVSATAIKMIVGLVMIKLFTLQFGTEGLGLAANFMTFLTVLGVLSGAGIFNGVTKFVASFEHNPKKLSETLSTASWIILSFSIFLLVVLTAFASEISQWLFYSDQYQIIIRYIAIIQIGLAVGYYFSAILKGFQNAKGNAVSLIISTIVGLALFLGLLFWGNYNGAVIGLAVVPLFVAIPASVFLKPVLKQLLPHSFSIPLAKQLLKYSVMVVVTAVTIPLAYFLLRDLLFQYHSLQAVGLWQGMTKISDAYLQFITAIFSVYLLPLFAKSKTKIVIKQQVKSMLIKVGIAMIGLSIFIYLFRSWIILLLYSAEFSSIESLFSWQLFGDFFKVLSYVFGYLIVAKTALRLYVLAEIFQLALLLLFGYLFIPNGAELGATQAYGLTYFCYFICCCVGFYLYQQRGNVGSETV